MKTNHWLARSMPKLLTPRLFTASAPLGTPTSISDTSLEMSLSSRVPVRRSLAASRWRPAPRVPRPACLRARETVSKVSTVASYLSPPAYLPPRDSRLARRARRSAPLAARVICSRVTCANRNLGPQRTRPRRRGGSSRRDTAEIQPRCSSRDAVAPAQGVEVARARVCGHREAAPASLWLDVCVWVGTRGARRAAWRAARGER